MINEYRNEIEKIDEQIKELFIERMKVVSKIKQYKLNNNLPVLDSSREEQLILKLTSNYSDENTIEYYKELIIKIIDLSKRFQNE